MIQKTKKYEMFKFRTDNRAELNQSHIRSIINSIKIRNMLEFRPILVNEDYEVIDGQNRLMAAKELGLDIYYTIQKDIEAKDMLLLNNSKAWGLADYHNFFLKNGYKEYQKLEDFIKKNGIGLRLGINLSIGRSAHERATFKDGTYKFENEYLSTELDLCERTISYIKKIKGSSVYLNSIKFWNACLRLVRDPCFNEEKWFDNLSKMIERIGPRTNTHEYCISLMEIMNHRNNKKVDLTE